jgi:hypothetical protein
MVAANEKSAEAFAQALGDKDLHGARDLASFRRQLAETDKDVMFQLEKARPADADMKETLMRAACGVGCRGCGAVSRTG